jgi:hypothetical protein
MEELFEIQMTAAQLSLVKHLLRKHCDTTTARILSCPYPNSNTVKPWFAKANFESMVGESLVITLDNARAI